MMAIEVRITGKGVVADEVVTADAKVVAHCDICQTDCDLVVSLTPTMHACRDCLRARLDASSVASWRLREPTPGGLPWGSIAG